MCSPNTSGTSLELFQTPAHVTRPIHEPPGVCPSPPTHRSGERPSPDRILGPGEDAPDQFRSELVHRHARVPVVGPLLVRHLLDARAPVVRSLGQLELAARLVEYGCAGGPDHHRHDAYTQRFHLDPQSIRHLGDGSLGAGIYT